MPTALAGTAYEVRATPQGRNSVDRGDRPACCGNASCIPVCPVQAKYDATVHLALAEAKGAELHEKTTAVFVELGADRRVSAIRFKRWDGSEGRATAKVFVIAAHAIETPRLLLASRSEATPNGVANGSDQLGRNLMDHPTPAQLGPGRSAALALSRPALDLGHREFARRRFPPAARGLSHRDRQ